MVNLLASPVTVSGGGVKIRATLQAKITTTYQVVTYDLVALAKYVMFNGAAGLAWAAANLYETDIYGPFSTSAAPVLTVEGAADNGSGLIRLTVNSTSGMAAGNTVTAAAIGGTTEANGQWIVDAVIDATHLDLRGSAFVHSYTTGGTVTVNGVMAATLSGNNVQIVATGITAAPWLKSEAVHTFDVRSNVNGTYMCSTPGTTASSGTGPSGTGTAISDGSALWSYVGSGTSVPILWTCFLETYPS